MKRLEKDIPANDSDWLYEEYITNKKGMFNIAKECGVSEDSIRTRLKRFNIPIRNHKDALIIRNKKNPYFPTKEEVGKISQKKRTGRHIKCLSCNKEFYVTKKSKKKFCSRDCNLNYWSRNRKEQEDWRDNTNYKVWRISVYKRDNYRCRICGSKISINAHHIILGIKNKTLRYSLNNGITLCGEHHKLIHSPNNKELLLQTSNIGGSLEVDNPEASIRECLYSLIRSND
jgi:hypothetical protein